MIRVHEDCISPSVEQIGLAARNSQGSVWIIGNEPDVIWQDNVTAIKYAATYHDIYGMIKSSDPTALIAVGGISQATPLRLQYLDQVLQTYQDLYHEPMPVDWWTVHGYVLREEKDSWGVDIPPGIDATQGELREVADHGRIDLFEAQLRAFRQWMAENGYQNTPLALTEFGILMPSSYGFPTDMVASYLEQTFTWLDQVQDEAIGYPADKYHLVQRWAWFSISDPTYSTSDLGDLSSGKLTIVGLKISPCSFDFGALIIYDTQPISHRKVILFLGICVLLSNPQIVRPEVQSVQAATAGHGLPFWDNLPLGKRWLMMSPASVLARTWIGELGRIRAYPLELSMFAYYACAMTCIPRR